MCVCTLSKLSLGFLSEPDFAGEETLLHLHAVEVLVEVLLSDEEEPEVGKRRECRVLGHREQGLVDELCREFKELGGQW